MRGDVVGGDNEIELADRRRHIGEIGELARDIEHAASEGAASDVARARLIEAEEAHARHLQQRRERGERDGAAAVFLAVVPDEADLEAMAGEHRLQRRDARGIGREISAHRRDGRGRDGEAMQQARHRQIGMHRRRRLAGRHDEIDARRGRGELRHRCRAGENDARGGAVQVLRETQHLDAIAEAAIGPEQERAAGERLAVPQRRIDARRAGAAQAPFVFGGATGEIALLHHAEAEIGVQRRIFRRGRDRALQRGDGFRELALLALHLRQAVERRGMAGAEMKHLLEAVRGFVVAAFLAERARQHEQRLGVLLAKPQCQTPALHGLIGAAEHQQREAEIDQRVG